MTESTHLLSSKRIPQLISERQRALKERGVGKAAHLIKDAGESKYNGSTITSLVIDLHCAVHFLPKNSLHFHLTNPRPKYRSVDLPPTV